MNKSEFPIEDILIPVDERSDLKYKVMNKLG